MNKRNFLKALSSAALGTLMVGNFSNVRMMEATKLSPEKFSKMIKTQIMRYVQFCHNKRMNILSSAFANAIITNKGSYTTTCRYYAHLIATNYQLLCDECLTSEKFSSISQINLNYYVKLIINSGLNSVVVAVSPACDFAKKIQGMYTKTNDDQVDLEYFSLFLADQILRNLNYSIDIGIMDKICEKLRERNYKSISGFQDDTLKQLAKTLIQEVKYQK